MRFLLASGCQNNEIKSLAMNIEFHSLFLTLFLYSYFLFILLYLLVVKMAALLFNYLSIFQVYFFLSSIDSGVLN